MLTISGAIMGDAKQPAMNVLLRPTRGQVPMQTKKSVLHDILRFVSREPETYQISQQRFAELAVQGGSLARVGRKAREWQREWKGIATHKDLGIVPLCIEQMKPAVF